MYTFPCGSAGKESACNAGDLGSIPGSGRSLEKEWQPTPVFLPGECQGQRSLVGSSSRVARVGYDLATTPPPPPCVCGLCGCKCKSLEVPDFRYACSIPELHIFQLFCNFWLLMMAFHFLMNRNNVLGLFFFLCVFSFPNFSLNNLIVNSHDTAWVYLLLQMHYLIDSVVLK